MSRGYRPNISKEDSINTATTVHKTKPWQVEEDRKLEQKNGTKTFAMIYMQLAIFGSLYAWLASMSFNVFLIVASSSALSVAFLFIMAAIIERQNRIISKLNNLERLSRSSN
jgi:hypothetical protein